MGVGWMDQVHQSWFNWCRSNTWRDRVTQVYVCKFEYFVWQFIYFYVTGSTPIFSIAIILVLAFFCKPLQAVADVLRNNHRDALLAGNSKYLVSSLCFYVRFSMMSGHSLSKLENECNSFAAQLVSASSRFGGFLCIGLTNLTYCLFIVDTSKPAWILHDIYWYLRAYLKQSGSRTDPFTLIPRSFNPRETKWIDLRHPEIPLV